MNRTQLRLLAALHRMNGSCEDRPSGHATKKLMDAAALTCTMTNVAKTLQTLEEQGFVAREVSGKRTFEIVLCALPDKVRIEMLGVPTAFVSAPVAEEPTQVTTLADLPPFPTAHMLSLVQTTPPEPDAIDYARLADELLRTAAEVIDRPHLDGIVKVRLADTLEENQRLKARLRVIEDENIALKNEASGLRRAKVTLEENLKAAIRGGGRVVDGEVGKRIARFMNEREPGILARTATRT